MSNVEQVQKLAAEVAETIVKEENFEPDIKEALRKVKGIVPEHLADAEVICVLFANEVMRVPAALMQQSKLFRDWVCHTNLYLN